MLRSKTNLTTSPVAVIVAMALMLFAAAMLCSCESHSSAGTQTVVLEAPAQPEEEEAESAEAEAEAEAEPEDESPAQIESSTSVEGEAAPEPEPEPAASSSAIDLSDPAQYQQINLFLSNFSEVYMPENPFVAQTASDQALCGFALWHTYRNSPDLVEHGEYYQGTYHYNIRITQERANELCLRYFNRTINFDNVTDMSQPNYCADGYVYGETTNGAGLPEGITLAKSAVDQGDGTIRIDFDIYFNGAPYDTTDTSLYGMSPDDLMATMGCSGPNRTGSALVYYGDYNDYTGGLVLASWRADAV